MNVWSDSLFSVSEHLFPCFLTSSLFEVSFGPLEQVPTCTGIWTRSLFYTLMLPGYVRWADLGTEAFPVKLAVVFRK